MKYTGFIFTLFVALLFTGCSDEYDTEETTVDEIVVDDTWAGQSGTLKNNDTNIDFIKEAYQALDKKGDFERYVSSSYGEIRWSESIGADEDSEKFVYFIPIAFKDGDKTEGV